MGRISLASMNAIKETAQEYMKEVKGKELTEEDIMIAENLIMFGYIKALEEKEKSKIPALQENENCK